ncbi:hypothetical protein [Streptomyces hesseae]|uniref:Uncharacterized protein n=1 Tax=Streptomyces hesseae TaxID=3075519 RepID=A0ABU2SM35_9ACTN|nr:hypothetical protein [Streptomyces sp. DSM 40473]MDT0449950.1 hypothetical protein [Streptomyces sp. DSM 40473]
MLTQAREVAVADEEPQEPAQAPVNAVRGRAEEILNSPPPKTPTAWYSGPEPPVWMTAPEITYDGAGRPAGWIDNAPYREWELRRGRAAYEVLREDERDRLRSVSQHEDVRPWSGYQDHASEDHANDVINHLRNRLTVKQREERGMTGHWGRPLPPPPKDDLPEAECSWQPWAYE